MMVRYILTKPEEHLIHRTSSLQTAAQITKRPKWVVERYVNSDKMLDGWKIIARHQVGA
ncbi:hypothetical protein [Secundilactobacillus kimchicus]|uniref:Uncharacterized protein n=2 Tax=Secundilactobacillus kimchicus TaxID=528209 RepID=A0A0R1HL31_9LACO|nr:hypothetical protein [Secundilactobacillus kimchicus]KRK47103.1 hypothetical protein FC96_GL000724 [Secundilactobacillus kimchicus JCM 15530]